MDLLTIQHEDFTMYVECTKFDGIWNKAKGNVGEEDLLSTYTWSEGVVAVTRNGEDIRIGEKERGVDTPPDDAINQMHRYRDAIYYKEYEGAPLKKEVIGGYILFPGDGEPAAVAESRFQESRRKVNIGAFPLRPGESRFIRSSSCCKIPKTNTEFWVKKIQRNKERDHQVLQKLEAMGWHCITIWECALKPSVREKTLESLTFILNRIFLENHRISHYEEQEESSLIAAEDMSSYVHS